MNFSGSSKLKIGVLAPNSNFVPFLANDMLAAMRFGLAEARLEVEISVGSAGYNADAKMVFPALQQLTLVNQVNCLVAPLNVSLIKSVADYCENQAVSLVALNLTEDPLFESARSSSVFVNSYYLWHTAWMSGYIAGQKFGSKGAAVAALHDSGYGLTFAFQLGLEAAQGKLICANTTHRNSSNEDPLPVISDIISQNPDFIWAAYSGREAISFLKAYSSLNQAGKPPLITLSPKITESMCSKTSDSFQDIWYLSGENFAAAGKSSLAMSLGREPNPYALLAYETAHLIADAIANNGANLNRAEFESVRGRIGFNRNSRENQTFYLYHKTADETAVEEILAPSLLNEQYQLACRKLTKQGWVNPYLCA